LQTRKQYLPCDVPHRTIEENLDEYPDEHRPFSPPVRCKMPKRKDQRIVSQPSVEPRRPRIEPYCDLTLDTDRLVPDPSTAGFSGHSGITRILGLYLVEEPQEHSHPSSSDFGSWSAPGIWIALSVGTSRLSVWSNFFWPVKTDKVSRPSIWTVG
jgi:hypothetical protein